MLGKMAIVAGVDSVLKPLIYDNDICFPEVNFVIETIPELINIIDNFDIYYSKYIDRYYEFIDDIGGVADFDEIFKTI
jgi:hypothetical protein